MPCLSPSALATAWPEHDAAVLGGVVEVDVQVALGLERDVDQASGRASCSSMWSRKPMPVAMS